MRQTTEKECTTVIKFPLHIYCPSLAGVAFIGGIAVPCLLSKRLDLVVHRVKSLISSHFNV